MFGSKKADANAGTQAQIEAELVVRQFREFLLTYNRIAEMCFADCTSEMKQRTVSEKEDECSRHCLEKYLKVTQRVTERFAEIQQIGQQGGLGDTANAFASTMKK